MKKKYTIAVAGTGYVGLSVAVLLAQHQRVLAVDIVPEKVAMINDRKSPIQDEYIERYFAQKQLDLTATLDAEAAYRAADFVVIATPTNYDVQQNYTPYEHAQKEYRHIAHISRSIHQLRFFLHNITLKHYTRKAFQKSFLSPKAFSFLFLCVPLMG